tara:strand:- start:69 stop:1163 length:1095 start_codon:yes stop_codon:yes gene_type:complete
MKWIGQHVWDYISRFRNDIYLDSPTAGGSDPDKFLGIDSNGKIIYRTGAEVASDIGAITSETGDISAVTAGTGLGGGGTTGAVSLSLDLTSGLSAVTPVNGDSLATLDSDASTHQLTTVANLATLFAGTGLTASNSVIGVDAAQTQITSVGTIGTGVWQGTAINQTYLNGQSGTNTGDETRSSIEELGITVLGTISEGTWQGTAIASAYLDADTAHYSATRQVTHHMITDDIDSDVIYISLGEIDAENSSATSKHLPLIAPTAGKLLKIFLRTSVDYSSETFTWKLYTRNVSSSTGGTPTEIGAQSGSGPTNKTMVTYDFTSSLDSGTNAIVAGDKVQISIEAGDGATANGNYFITCLWEWDLS